MTSELENPFHPDILTYRLPQKLPGGLRLPTRMTVVAVRPGELALISCVPIDDAAAARIATLGEVRYLIAPNLLHHLYLGPAVARYPNARVAAPKGLREKRPDLRIDSTLEELAPSLLPHLEIFPIRGAPSVDEHTFFHVPSRTLIVTDLVFHITRPEGWVTRVILTLAGCHGRLARSRNWSLFFIRDKAAFQASCQELRRLPIESLIMAHGELLPNGAREPLGKALC